MSDRHFDERLADAYREALKAANNSAIVAIRVGHRARQRMAESVQPAIPTDAWHTPSALLNGIPIIVDPTFEPDGIQVHSIKVIR